MRGRNEREIEDNCHYRVFVCFKIGNVVVVAVVFVVVAAVVLLFVFWFLVFVYFESERKE